MLRIGFCVLLACLVAGCTAAGQTDLSSLVPSATAEPGTGRVDAAGVEQVWVPAGSFRMGTTEGEAADVLAAKPPTFVKQELPSEQPAHTVTITTGYWIDRYEVSRAAFKAFVDAGGYQKQAYWSDAGWKWLQGQGKETPACSSAAEQSEPDLPCVGVTWFEADAYARWRGGRLPSEAEWEYAARGPDSRIYPWGNTFDPTLANVINRSATVPVTSYPEGASWAGALNMAGNAMEWVQDWLDVKYYSQNIASDPPGPPDGTVKIEKGGWWGSNLFVARSAYRHFEDPPSYGDGHIGFRIVSR
jgi:formylglycine-generating enzyme required for sulfatase activity